MPRDAAPAPIHDTISVVVDVNKLGRQLHLHDDQASGPLLLLPASICRSFPWLERLPQAARLDGLASQSRGCDALPYGHRGLLRWMLTSIACQLRLTMVSINQLPLTWSTIMYNATLARMGHGKYVGARGEPRRDGVYVLKSRTLYP